MDSLDICPHAVNASTAGMRTYGTFLYAFGTVFTVLCYLSSICAKRFRRFARLEARHEALTYILCFGAFLHLQIDPLALMIGRENYACGAFVLQLFIIPLLGGPVVARVVSLHFRSRFEKQAMSEFRQSVRHDAAEQEDDQNERLDARGIVHAFIWGFRDAFFCQVSVSKLNLRSLRYLASGHGISFLIFAIFLAPALLVGVIVAATEPVLTNCQGCTGVGTPQSVAVFLITQGFILSLLTFLVLFRVKREYCPDEVRVLQFEFEARQSKRRLTYRQINSGEL